MDGDNKQMRLDALAQLKTAQQMIEQGRADLLAANEKIQAAQQMIDDSAKILRDTPHEKH